MILSQALKNIHEKVKALFKYDDVRGPPFLLSTRFLMAVLAFTAYMVQYMQKMMTSVGIVCMVNNTWIKEQNKNNTIVTQTNYTFYNESYWFNYTTLPMNTTTAADPCFFKDHHNAIDGTLKWTKDTQGLVLASFFWGYIITEIPGGWLSTRFGTRIVLFIAFLIASTATLLLPVSARLNLGLFLALRVLNGAALGVLWPSIASMWSRWAPPDERSRLIGIGNSGSQIGNAIALPLGSYLCLNGFDQGWGSIYYIFGIVSVIWCVIWLLLSSDSPETHRLISQKEKEYILNATKETAAAHAEHESLKDAPWKEIMTSIPCISFYITLTCNLWGAYTFLTNIPTYMKEVLKFDIKSNGGLSAVPYILFWIAIIISGNIADRILKTNKLSRTTVRKIFNATSNFIPMAAVIGLMFIDCTNPYGGLALLCLGLAFTGTGYGAGFMVNANDIAGNYAGLVFGVGNTFGTIPGIVAPYVVGILTPHSLQTEWRNVFIITAVIYFVGGAQSLIFTSGDLQAWAHHTPSQRKSLSATTKEDKKVIINEMHEIVLENTAPTTLTTINDQKTKPADGNVSKQDNKQQSKIDIKTIQAKPIDVNLSNNSSDSSISTAEEAWNNEMNSVHNPDLNAESIQKNIETFQAHEQEQQQQQEQNTPQQEHRTDSKKIKSHKYIRFP